MKIKLRLESFEYLWFNWSHGTAMIDGERDLGKHDPESFLTTE